jgi:hypothetical protein
MGFKGEYDPARRNLIIGLGATAIAAGTGSTVLAQTELLKTPEIQEPIKFLPNRIGINLNYRNFYNYHQNPQELLPKLLSFPGEHVRLSVYLDDIFRDGKADFSRSDNILDMCFTAGKKVHLVLGTKTTGGDEFNLSPRFLQECPEYEADNAVIGSTEKQRQILQEEVGQVAFHYLFSEKYGKKLSSIHRTNEGYSEHLVGVTNKRVDPRWNEQEYELIQKLNRFSIPLVQNIPEDTWGNTPTAMFRSDIPAINIYPQASRLYFGSLGASVAQTMFWKNRHETFATAKENENVELSERMKEDANGYFITEAQIAPWLDANLYQKYPFDKKIVMDMLRRIQSYNPAVVFLWDLEQLYRNKDFGYIQQLHDIVAT